MIRKPVVAGVFYSQDKEQLKQDIAECWPVSSTKAAEGIAALMPHAGYIYSGETAARTAALLPKVSTAIILGPNHTGQGSRCAVSDAEAWETPLGLVPVNRELSEQIVEQCSDASFNNQAHAAEHSIEVLLPFLQFEHTMEQLVAISVSLWDVQKLKKLGTVLSEVVKHSREPILLITSSDMNHFEDLATTQTLDDLALAEILNLDPDRLMKVVSQNNISMCGILPAIAMIAAVNKISSHSRARLVDHTTSAKSSGDPTRVVGYAGVLIEK